MKILIIAPSWVGDLVMSQALYRLLKQKDPDGQIDVLAPLWCLDIIKRMPGKVVGGIGREVRFVKDRDGWIFYAKKMERRTDADYDEKENEREIFTVHLSVEGGI